MLYFSKVSSCDLAAATTLQNTPLLYMHLRYKQPFFNRLQAAILQPTTSSHSSTHYKQPFFNRLQAALHQPTTSSHSSTDYKQPFINRQHYKPPLYEQIIKIRNRNFTQTLLKLFKCFVTYIMLLHFLSTGIAV